VPAEEMYKPMIGESMTGHASTRELRAIEYIGLHVAVVKSKSKTVRGLRGIVVDETLNTFLVEKADGKVVRVPKTGCLFKFKMKGKTFEVEGSEIMFRPEDRPKKV
jgi:ribonuclease P protein subunit POP4